MHVPAKPSQSSSRSPATRVRWLFLACIAVAILLSLLAWKATRAQVNDDPPRYLFGVISDQGQHDVDMWARGVRATTLELHWKLYEPQPGVYDLGYIHAKQERLVQLKAQGWYVQLVPGYQYVPEWVFTNYPNMHYVNQYGERYEPTRNSFRVINAPFNPEARALIAGYIARVFQDFPASNFDSVRVGGSVQGELRYPPQSWNGHNNSYWAFDAHAQNAQESAIPQEVVGWRPGIDRNPGSIDRGQLLVNSGFEETHPYLSLLGWAPDDEELAEVETDAPHGGNRALRLTLSGTHRVHQFVAVQPGQTYRFGGWLRSAEGQGRARLFLNQYDAAMQPVSGVPYGRVQTSAQEWSEQVGSLTLSPSTHYLKVELDGSEAGTYYFDDLWLMREGETNLASRDIRVPLAFYDWYVQTLTDYQNWQIAQLRQHYAGQLDLVYPGKGSLPHQINDALTNDLRGNGWSEQSSALYAGTAYDRHVAELSSTQNLALYLTGIDEPPASQVNDLSLYPRYWSAARWLGFLASSRGLPIWAENSGQDDVTKLHLSVQRMRDNGFFGLLWAFESELYANPNANQYATIQDYEAVIAEANRPQESPTPTRPLELYLPLIQRP
jgi:hypothetical protein